MNMMHDGCGPSIVQASDFYRFSYKSLDSCRMIEGEIFRLDYPALALFVLQRIDTVLRNSLASFELDAFHVKELTLKPLSALSIDLQEFVLCSSLLLVIN